MIKKRIKNIFWSLSRAAVNRAVKENDELSAIWGLSYNILPSLDEHYITARLSEEESLRARLLICSQASFLRKVITVISENGQAVNNYLDIGDSDGSARILLKESMKNVDIDTLGINLQPKAVEKMKQKGLEAECIDAMELSKQGRRYDIVSVFETLEHLPNPIGFLESIHSIVNHRLAISVPLICKSRVSLRYLDDKWPGDKIPTIENIHVFELSPEDWSKIFLHCGWEIEFEKKVRQFPKKGMLALLMKYTWRKISFEGYWFVSLKKNDEYRKRYCIE
ncbi:MAG: class I SAM-dependent methyltransferase [Thermodesulfovibrionia bacterium]|nr:class I SAM-dependent methyltransferase [Thermodesulfovibrionia bacterium]